MDNASKAIIMAGAIMVAVAIVSLGVYLLNLNTADVQESIRRLEQSEVIKYNEKYLLLEGYQRTASQARQMIQLIERHNSMDDETETYGYVELKSGTNYITQENQLDPARRYDILITEYDDRNVITGVSITNAGTY